MARAPQRYLSRGYGFTIHRSGFVGRIEIDLTGSKVNGTLVAHYTTREASERHDLTYFKTHERAVGYAIGLIAGLCEADAIDDASVPTLTLLEGGLT